MKVPTSELWGLHSPCSREDHSCRQPLSIFGKDSSQVLHGHADHGRIFQTAALFILGMVIGRQGWMLKEYQKGWGIAACWALPLFCALRGLDLMLPDYILNKDMLDQAHLLLSSLYNLCFMILIVAGVLFLFYNTTGTKEMLCRLIPYGRMSMSNYVSQSIIGSFIYYNWGLGLHDRLGITASFLVGIVIFLAQLSFCRIWMKRFSHGTDGRYMETSHVDWCQIRFRRLPTSNSVIQTSKKQTDDNTYRRIQNNDRLQFHYCPTVIYESYSPFEREPNT